MKKILLLPLLNSMPSGHHQVAAALSEYVSEHTKSIECKKVDLLSEWNPVAESAIVKIYRNWIHYMPNLYGKLYRLLANHSKASRSHKLYEFLFLNKMEDILEIEKPDLIICTHALPSYLLNQLKKKGRCSIPVLNVYTDFFVNEVWGISDIDCHFTPTKQLKSELHERYSVPENRIFITGIPVSSTINKRTETKIKEQSTLLIFGGGMKVEKIIEELKVTDSHMKWNFRILNSKNNVSGKKTRNRMLDSIQLLPDISSKEKMNDLYNEAAAFVTKPGGVLIGEAVRKNLPIFIHSTLPGQEEINLDYLAKEKLVFKIPPSSNMLKYVENTLSDSKKMAAYQENIQEYKETVELKNSSQIYAVLERFMNEENASFLN